MYGLSSLLRFFVVFFARCRCCCCRVVVVVAVFSFFFFSVVSVVTSSLIFSAISAMRIFMLVGDCILWARACKFFKLPKKRTLQTAHRFIRYYLNAGAMHLFDTVLSLSFGSHTTTTKNTDLIMINASKT